MDDITEVEKFLFGDLNLSKAKLMVKWLHARVASARDMRLDTTLSTDDLSCLCIECAPERVHDEDFF